MTITYSLIRSSRKTLAVEIKADGQIIVRAPYRMSKKEIDRFLELSKNYFEQKGYSVYFTGARYTYNGKTSTVGQNYYMIAIKE